MTRRSLVSVFSFVTAPFYLAVVCRRDASGDDTNGNSLRMVAMVVACVVFVVAAMLFGVA